jgi:hypothetical protein
MPSLRSWRRILALDAAVLAVHFACALVLGRQGAVVFAIVAVVTGIRLVMVRDWRHIAVFFVGVVLGAGADALQVTCGTYTYAHPSLGPLPAYMLVTWGQIFLLLLSVLSLANEHEPGWPPGRPRPALATVNWAVATAAVCLLHAAPWSVAATCAAMSAIVLIADRRTGDGVLCLLAAWLGPAAEGILVTGGVYTFSTPTVAGLPVWHPFYWVACILLLRRLWAVWPGDTKTW